MKLTTLTAVSFRQRFSPTSVWRRIMQCVVITDGIFRFIKAAGPERELSIAGALSVQKATSFSHMISRFSKYLLRTSETCNVVLSSCEGIVPLQMRYCHP